MIREDFIEILLLWRSFSSHPNRLKESSVCPRSAPRRRECLPLFLIKIPSSGVLEDGTEIKFYLVFVFFHVSP